MASVISILKKQISIQQNTKSNNNNNLIVILARNALENTEPGDGWFGNLLTLQA